jgi:uroporphyrinogen-III decarboxylase
VKRCLDRWKSYGYYVIFHSDGRKWPMIQDLIDMGFDSINPCEPLATMEVARFRREYPDTVIGSMVDCQNLLAFGTPEEVRAVTLQAIEDSGGARTLIGSTSEIHPGIGVDNALAMYETARSYRL